MSLSPSEPLARAVVVTGASTGIGRAVVAKVAAEGGLAFAGVRKEADADSLRQEFGDKVHPLLFDVTHETAVRAAAAVVEAKLSGRTLLGLVNNAGVAVPGALLHLSSEELRRQIEINLIGVHSVTRAFARALGAHEGASAERPGRIVMISSVSGKGGSPFLGPYAASKHALEGYSESLRRELMLYGVDVIIIGPGSIATPIWAKGDADVMPNNAPRDYAAPLANVREYMRKLGEEGLPASDVGDLVWKVLTTRTPRTRYTIMRHPLSQAAPALLPKRYIDKVIAKRLGLVRK
jgi:NAD(P)-dependent dehydrogenase (short-subunit alcohol dehydrogenase family)